MRFTNLSPTNASAHVHGQYNRAPFDGWAADYALPGQYKDYYYPNAQNARTIWYHVSEFGELVGMKYRLICNRTTPNMKQARTYTWDFMASTS